MKTVKRVLLIGNPNTVFVGYLSKLFADTHEVYVVGSKEYAPNTEYFKYLNYRDVLGFIGVLKSRMCSKYYTIVQMVEIAMLKMLSIVEHEKAKFYPVIADILSKQLYIDKAIEIVRPDHIIALDALRYGLLLKKIRHKSKFVMPFGNDIYLYDSEGLIRYALLRDLFNSDMKLLIASKSSVKYIEQKYSVSLTSVLLPTVVSSDFNDVVKDTTKANLKIKMGFSENSEILFFCRKFVDSHGAEDLLRLVGDLVNECEFLSDMIIIILTDDINGYYAKRLREVTESNESVKILEYVSFDSYIQLCLISDYFISNLVFPDMRSLSLFQNLYCGSVPILNRQDEYEMLLDEGLKMVFYENYTDLFNIVMNIKNIDKSQFKKNKKIIEKIEASALQEFSKVFN